jgi:hypothetical protein
LKLRPFTPGELRNCLAEDEFLEMLGLLVGRERRFRREYFVEEELLRFRYALMDQNSFTPSSFRASGRNCRNKPATESSSPGLVSQNAVMTKPWLELVEVIVSLHRS